MSVSYEHSLQTTVYNVHIFLLQRHRAVNDVLSEELKTGVHALSIIVSCFILHIIVNITKQLSASVRINVFCPHEG